MTSICGYARYEDSDGDGVDGLTVTWDVDRVTRADGTRSALVTGGANSITFGRDGLYGYRIADADVLTYDYIFTAITASATPTGHEVAAVQTWWALDWAEVLMASLTTSGSFGKLIADYVDAAISSRATQADIVDDATAFHGASVAAILADTNELQGDWTNDGRLDVILDAVLVDTGTTLPSTLSTIQAKTDLLGTLTVTISSPVSSDGTATTIRGVRYLNADGNRLEWEVSTWDIASDSTFLIIIQGETSFTATYLTSTSIGLELTAAQTRLISYGDKHQFTILELKRGATDYTPLLQGVWNSKKEPSST